MKLKINYIIDVAMLIAFFACGITGILKLPELSIPVSDGAFLAITAIHDWSGVVSLALILAHVILHLKWFASATKTIFAKKKKETKAESALKSGTSPEGTTADAKSTRPRKAHGTRGLLTLIAVLILAPLASSLYARPASNPTIPQGISYSSGSLKDGTYTGTATGFMPGLTVQVSVKNGAIKSVDIVSQNETPRWFSRVSGVMPGRVVSAQGTDVDSVSGATCSSEGILSAVENALAKAKK